jgi:hypothetical protein
MCSYKAIYKMVNCITKTCLDTCFKGNYALKFQKKIIEEFMLDPRARSRKFAALKHKFEVL